MSSPEDGADAAGEGEVPDDTGGDSPTDDFSKPGPSVTYSLFECAECSTTVLGIHEESPDLVCHGRPMEPIDEAGIDHADPGLDLLLTKVYELPRIAIDICHFVFKSGVVSIKDTAEHFDYDRSTVARYLSDLAEAGFIEKHTLNREDGGIVHVYQPRSLEETRRAELVGFLHWAGTATMLLDEANEIKAQCADHDEGLDEVFWDVYQTQRTL